MTDCSAGRIDALRRAIEHPNIRTQSNLARLLSVHMKRTIKQGHVSHWLRKGLPSDYCPAVERITERKVTCEELGPADVPWEYLRAKVGTGGSHA